MTTKSRFAGVATRHERLAAADPSQDEGAVKSNGRPPGKKTDPNYTQVTVYLEKKVHHNARKVLFDSHRQFSDLVNELVSTWLDSQTSGNLDS